MTLRLNKKWLVYSVIAGLVAAFVSLGIVHAQQLSEKSSLNDELDTAEENLSMLEAGQSTSWQDTQTNNSQTDYDTARTTLSQTIDSIIASEALFEIAEASSVTLTSITVSPMLDNELAELPCSFLPLNVGAEGNENALLDFISRLNTDLTNGIVRLAILHIPESPAEGEASADIELIIYTYQGE
jgi:hypothetical protein